MNKTIAMFCSLLAAGTAAAGVICSGDSASVAIDTRTAPLVADSIAVTYDASWIGGDASATVAISDNGVEVRRTTGAGEFTHTPTGAGRHELTYTTLVDGVAQEEVYRAVVYKGKYTIRFNAHGGEGTMPDCELGIGMPLPECTFTKDGHFLLGWALTQDGEATLLDGDSTADIVASQGETVTLYAVWHETVSNVAAKQRYPWNGLVDISFTLSGPESGYWVAVTATNSATSEAIPVRTLRDRAGNAITRRTEFAPGMVSLVWDAGTDVPNTLIEALALCVVTAPPPPGVQLWAGGPIWAEKNVGAEVPEDYGLYFWWGDTVGYRREGSAWVASDGSSQNFQFSDGNTPTDNKSPSTLQSEGWVTADGVLAPSHDAAHVHWGGNWRMPTEDELSALNSNCDWTWTTRNGVNGYVVRGRNAYSEASIFLPAAGDGYGTSLGGAGSDGNYWSSVPESDSDLGSWYLGFDSGRHGPGGSGRFLGQSVRPVLGFAE